MVPEEVLAEWQGRQPQKPVPAPPEPTNLTAGDIRLNPAFNAVALADPLTGAPAPGDMAEMLNAVVQNQEEVKPKESEATVDYASQVQAWLSAKKVVEASMPPPPAPEVQLPVEPLPPPLAPPVAEPVAEPEPVKPATGPTSVPFLQQIGFQPGQPAPVNEGTKKQAKDAAASILAEALGNLAN